MKILFILLANYLVLYKHDSMNYVTTSIKEHTEMIRMQSHKLPFNMHNVVGMSYDS